MRPQEDGQNFSDLILQSDSSFEIPEITDGLKILGVRFDKT
jgi:hypothetical protein